MALAVFGCGSGGGPAQASPVADGACAVAPTETLGPFPSAADLVRSDIREDRTGLPLTLVLAVVNANAGCAAVAGATVGIWQCDAQGRYSEYAQAGFDGRAATFLRGVQTTDASGRVTFTTVYPGWYAGRATHIHVEVSVGGRSVKVTQIGFPEDVSATVYGRGVYAAKGRNPTSNGSDGVFADSIGSEIATVTGDPASALTATFTLGVAV
jgi:protocatechuate 3,4-dioxygenase beta subunit